MSEEPLHLGVIPVEEDIPATGVPVKKAKKKSRKKAGKKAKRHKIIAEPEEVDLAVQIPRVNPLGDSAGNMIRYDLVIEKPAAIKKGPSRVPRFWERIEVRRKGKKKK